MFLNGVNRSFFLMKEKYFNALLKEPTSSIGKDELDVILMQSVKACFGSYSRKLLPKRVSEINFYHDKYNNIDDIAKRIKVMEEDFLSGSNYVKFDKSNNSFEFEINRLISPFNEGKRAWFSLCYSFFGCDSGTGGLFIPSIAFYSKKLPMIYFYPNLFMASNLFKDINEYLNMKLSHEWSHYEVMKGLCSDEQEFKSLPYALVKGFDELIAELNELDCFSREKRDNIFNIIVYHNEGSLPVLSKELPVLDDPKSIAKELKSSLSHAVKSNDWQVMLDYLNDDYSNWRGKWTWRFEPFFNHLGKSIS